MGSTDLDQVGARRCRDYGAAVDGGDLDSSLTGDEPEVLVLGPAGAGSGRRRRQVVVVLTVVVLALAAATAASSWLRSSDPTFSRSEVIEVYRTPPPTAGPPLWDPDKITTDDTEPDPDPPTQPAACSPLLLSESPLTASDSVGAALTPAGGRRTRGDTLGMAVTFRYQTPEEARQILRRLRQSLDGCSDFSTYDTRFRLDQLALGDDRRSRSDLSFRLRFKESSVLVHVVRFGNTVTWVVDEEDAPSAAEVMRELPEVVVSRLQAIYRDR